ncbi:glycosyl transferase family protein [Candidatus Magnetobacterium bavaricum]|uniref:Glycosyl transferase family protein n=1 Tax=Candidatus Magnetobacterium bavaricum TaxID=29290 RepID=A0A0F3GZS2_9BACT|nr:glycosyl transferase family protein [Candidatus Magnetobacterium bavaricum]
MMKFFDKDRFFLLHIYSLVAGFLIRLYLATVVEGYPADISCFRSWAIYVADKGFANFYSGEIFADYPPGYIYVLYLVGKIRAALSMSYTTTSYLVLVKLPPIIADIITAGIIFRLAARGVSIKSALVLSLIYLFNPAVILNSCLWGQVDAVFTLCILLTLMAITGQRLVVAALLFVVSVLVKPQALIFSPVIVFAFLMQSWSKESLKTIAIATGCAIGLFALAVMPFSIHKDAFWIFSLYQKTLASYPYASLNAFNLFALTGGNFQADSTRFLFMSYSTWGIIFILWTVIVASYLFYKNRTPQILPLLALFIITAVYVTTSKMHERYLFPAMLIALFSYIHTKDKRLLYIYGAITATLFINQADVLSMALRGSFHIQVFDPLMLTVSAINVAILVYLVLVANDIVHNRVSELRTSPQTPRKTNKTPNESPVSDIALSTPVKSSLRRVDYVFIAAFILLNAVLVFYKLGSSRAPETFWKPAGPETEAVAFEFDSPRDVARVCFLGGIGEGQYGIDYINNAGRQVTATSLKQVFVFEWRCEKVDFTTNTVLLNVRKPGAMLKEIGFFDKSDALINIRNVRHINPDPNSVGKVADLIDEQDTVPTLPSYLNSSYFDEIYFARTAYEQVHGITPFYENTHPPLGKHFIAVCVAVLGMNPFGWRVASALAAVVMVVLMYLFGRLMFDSTRYAVVAAFLMSFDFMRFVQGRIATIDTFAVCFIILMYYFMYRYYLASIHCRPLKETLLPLGLSGLSFGLGAATKWICLYAGAGLAVVFFASLYFRYAQYRKAGEQLPVQKSKKKHAKKKDSWQLSDQMFAFFMDSIMWASLFFVIIPAVVYILSYLPLWMAEPTRPFFDYVQSSQTHMFNYHKNLVATHPFSSNWYEWPILKKPLWLYAGQSYLPPGQVSSIVSMGNPAIWWLFAPVVVFIASMLLKTGERVLFFIMAGAAAQYLPWVAVPRLTFIYHFFASVPFLIISLVYIFKWMEGKYRYMQYITYCYLAVVLGLFVLFYPVISGMIVSKSYVSTYLRWFESWILFS